jgi:hypothetical protein
MLLKPPPYTALWLHTGFEGTKVEIESHDINHIVIKAE